MDSDRLEDRIVTRSKEGASSSEATPAVAAAMVDRFVRWPEATELDTTRPLDASVADALVAMGWPAVTPTVAP